MATLIHDVHSGTAHTAPPDPPQPPAILVVDDDQLMRKLLSFVLSQAGYCVDTAADGRDGLAQVRSAPPDLMLLDVMMPCLTGLEVLEQMMRDPVAASIPVILVTALEESMLALQHVRMRMAVSFLSKPFEHSRLLAQVEKHLTTRRGRDSLPHLPG